MTRPFTLLAALIFALMALSYAYRLFTDFQFVLGSHVIPMWVSYFGIIIPGLLAIMLYRKAAPIRQTLKSNTYESKASAAAHAARRNGARSMTSSPARHSRPCRPSDVNDWRWLSAQSMRREGQ